MIKKLSRKILRRYVIKSTLLPILLLILAGTGVSLWLWHSANRNIDAEIDSLYSAAVRGLNQTLNQRIDVYEEVLLGGSGFFAAQNNDVTAAEWRAYVQPLDVRTRLPGLLSVGYIEIVAPENLDQHNAAMIASGVTDYTVKPAGERKMYAPVLFHEPKSNPQSNGGIGFDMYSDPIREQALNQARDSGQSVVSDPIWFFGDNSQRGFNIYHPVYSQPSTNETERRANTIGFIFAAVRIKDLFEGIISPQLKTSAGLRIFEGTEKTGEKLAYESDNINDFINRADLFIENHQISLKGKTYTVESFVTRDIVFSATKRNQPKLILATGLMATIMLSALLLLLIRGRSRELSFAKQLEVQSFKDELLSLASHQLRTPATGVKQYIGMVLQGYAGSITKEQRSMLDKANASNERQLEIVDQILHVTKLEAGSISLHNVRLDLTSLIRDVIDEQLSTIRSRRHKIVFRTSRPIYVYGDQQYLRMVIENLLSNAVKYMRSRGTITITPRSRRNEITVDVSDTGVGIAPEDYSKLFQKFSRIDNELSIQAGGSGVGLYLASLIMAQHGGSIEAMANPKKGTTFRIVLPKLSG